MSIQREEDVSKKVPEANYTKSEEHIVETYDDARTLADALYSNYTDGSDTSGSSIERTCDAAKVRIRRRTGSHGRPDSFRVVLLKSIFIPRTPETITEEPTDADADGSTPKITKAERRKEIKSNRRKSKSGRN